MALRLSTGLRQALLGTASFQSEFNLSKINIYSGTQPSSPDDAATGTLLVTISNNGGATGLTFDAPVAGSISKAAAETWSGTAVADGTAGWFRLYENLDTPGSSSTTASRIDGNIATSGANMNMSNTFIANAAVQTVSSFSVTLPSS